jgi:hypothetical protein
LGYFSELPQDWEKNWGRSDWWHRTEKHSERLTQTYTSGLPIISRTLRGKPAWAAASVYIDPRVLLADGKFQKGAIRKFQRQGRFVARANVDKKLSTRQVHAATEGRVRSRECFVELRQTSRFMQLLPTRGKNCVSLEEELEKNPKAGQGKPKRKPRGKRPPAPK